MIRISSSLLKTLFTPSPALTRPSKCFFAKQAKPGKQGKGGKQQKKAQTPVEQQPSQKLLPHEKMINYFTPLQTGLSPSEKEALTSSFSDIQQEEKEMLDQLAQRIAELNTSMFYDLAFRREMLGTSDALVVGTGEYEDAEIKEAIHLLRKDL